MSRAVTKYLAGCHMGKRSRKIDEKSRKGRIWAKTDGHCHLCGEKLYLDKWHIDHVVPRTHSGIDDEWNLLPCCTFCNGMKKAAKTYRMRRFLMYGRYCLEEATRRDKSDIGQAIYDFVGGRVKTTASGAQSKPAHIQLWKQTPRKLRYR